ncbi:MAG: tyrosine-protein phosphatase [Streptomycetaceae bacterium]|nr:tyrosine-protein phosphatase [Streptomycetaceae bacterium]
MQRHIAFERLHNFRDMGGYRTADGREVAWGRLYRSDSLGKLARSDADGERFAALGVRTVVDLRYPWEIERAGRVGEYPGLAYHNLSIEHRPYGQATLGPEVPTERFLADRYAEVAGDGVAEIRAVLDVLAADGAGPAVVHCASGKDRTGLIAALVLTLLGVGDEDIVADFALTERASERLIADWNAARPDIPITWPGYARAPEGVMRLFLAGIAAEYGSLRGYAEARLGVDGPLVEALRKAYLAD